MYVLVGAGGLGNELAPLICRSLGKRQLVVIDQDWVELSNLNRQVGFYRSDIDQAKAKSLSQKLRERYCGVNVIGVVSRVEDASIQWEKVEFIFSAVDTMAARVFLSRIANLFEIPLINGGSNGFSGQVNSVFLPSQGCLECAIGERPDAGPTVATCTMRSNLNTVAQCVAAAHLIVDAYRKRNASFFGDINAAMSAEGLVKYAGLSFTPNFDNEESVTAVIQALAYKHLQVALSAEKANSLRNNFVPAIASTNTIIALKIVEHFAHVESNMTFLLLGPEQQWREICADTDQNPSCFCALVRHRTKSRDVQEILREIYGSTRAHRGRILVDSKLYQRGVVSKTFCCSFYKQNLTHKILLDS